MQGVTAGIIEQTAQSHVPGRKKKKRRRPAVRAAPRRWERGGVESRPPRGTLSFLALRAGCTLSRPMGSEGSARALACRACYEARVCAPWGADGPRHAARHCAAGSWSGAVPHMLGGARPFVAGLAPAAARLQRPAGHVGRTFGTVSGCAVRPPGMQLRRVPWRLSPSQSSKGRGETGEAGSGTREGVGACGGTCTRRRPAGALQALPRFGARRSCWGWVGGLEVGAMAVVGLRHMHMHRHRCLYTLPRGWARVPGTAGGVDAAAAASTGVLAHCSHAQSGNSRL
jgi:hypothetical protein